MIHTIETRLKLNTTQELLVNSCVVLWSSYYRKTWKLWNNQQLKENEIYHELMNLNLKCGVVSLEKQSNQAMCCLI